MTIDDMNNKMAPWEQSAQKLGHVHRRLYRHGSLPANLQLAFDEPNTEMTRKTLIPLSPIEGATQLRSTLTPSGGMIGRRSRASTGVSMRSRKASRYEYHEDLKPSLQQGLTRNLLFMSCVILIGTSFQFGYNIGVLNQPVELIKEFYNSTYTERYGSIDEYMLTFVWSLTTAIALPGGMIGAFSAGYIADKLGRKRAVLVGNVPALIGAGLSAACMKVASPELLMIGRFVTGINCGMATQLAPLYLAEITPFNLRGAFGTANQLFITVGIFVSSVFGLREILGTEAYWPYLLLVNAAPAIVCLLMMPCLPDSPRYLLINRNRRSAAVKALKFLRQQSDVSADMEEMETECQDSASGKSDESSDGGYTMKKLLTTSELRLPLLVTVVLQITQQLSGINAIFFYSTGIYRNAGVPENAIQFAVLTTNAVNVIMTIIAVPAMDRAGRRPLLLYPMAAMIAILGVITVAIKYQQAWPWLSYVSMGCVIAYVVCFAVGLGPIPMMISAELFRQGPRPRAMSLAGLTNWLFTAVVAISFELIQKALREYTFLIFLVLMILFLAFVYLKVPETKNKTFEEIASQFQPGSDLEVEEVLDDDEVFPKNGGDGVTDSDLEEEMENSIGTGDQCAVTFDYAEQDGKSDVNHGAALRREEPQIMVVRL